MNYEEHLRLAGQLISKRMQGLHSAEDLAQSAIRSCLSYQAGSLPDSEVALRIYWKARDYERGARPTVNLTVSRAGGKPCSRQIEVEEREELALLPVLVAQLPEELRRVAQLLRSEHTAKSISEELGISVDRAYKLQAEAVAALRVMACEVS